MKKVLLAMMFLCPISGAFAGDSCLTQNEAGALADIRSRLLAERMKNPDCGQRLGLLGCAGAIDRAAMQWLERKENGDPLACPTPPAESSQQVEE